MNKLCKVHPNMKQFLEENMYGMNKIEELAEEACKMYKALIDTVKPNEPGGTDRLMDSEFKNYLTPNALDVLKNYEGFLPRPYECPDCGKLAKVNLFGFLKLGERAKGELTDDIKNHYVHSERFGGDFFDLESCIHVGLRIKPLMKGIESVTEGERNSPVFDVSTILIRGLNTGNVLGNTEEVETAILTVMISRLIIMYCARKELACMVDNAVKLKHGEIGDSRGKNYDLKEVLKSLFIYKVWYNAINDIDNLNVEKSVENIMDLVNLAARSFNATQAISDVYNTIHSKIMTGVMDCPRYPDKVIEKTMNMYRQISNYYGFREDNGRRSHATNVSRKVVVGVESFAFESFVSSMGVIPGFRDKKRASLTLLGFESVQTSTREFDEFKKKSRAQILAKLSNDERTTYIKYESDIMKFRAEAIGCRTPFSQSTILKKGETLGKLINMELSKTHSEEFVTMMSMLDSERVSVQSELANRDFFRERTTMLNGQMGSMKDEWTY